VRVGGEIRPPVQTVRVEPIYPEIAARAQIQGLVILEATVDIEGRVTDVRVLRSVKLLDDAAIAAVRQWRYEPLTLNDQPAPFVLTVSLSFKVDTASGR
jgi:protein TonB